jgi:hypothetical protein
MGNSSAVTRDLIEEKEKTTKVNLPTIDRRVSTSMKTITSEERKERTSNNQVQVIQPLVRPPRPKCKLPRA